MGRGLRSCLRRPATPIHWHGASRPGVVLVCFGGQPAQQQVNVPANPVDQAYKDVVQTTQPDTSPATTDATTPAATPQRQVNTGITFAKG